MTGILYRLGKLGHDCVFLNRVLTLLNYKISVKFFYKLYYLSVYVTFWFYKHILALFWTPIYGLNRKSFQIPHRQTRTDSLGRPIQRGEPFIIRPLVASFFSQFISIEWVICMRGENETALFQLPLELEEDILQQGLIAAISCGPEDPRASPVL